MLEDSLQSPMQHTSHQVFFFSFSFRQPQTIHKKKEIYIIYIYICKNTKQKITKHYSSGRQVKEEIAPLLQKDRWDRGEGGCGEGSSDTSSLVAPISGWWQTDLLHRVLRVLFTSSCVRRSACTWHKCSPPSPPSPLWRPRRPGGTTGYSCRHTGPSSPADKTRKPSNNWFGSLLKGWKKQPETCVKLIGSTSQQHCCSSFWKPVESKSNKTPTPGGEICRCSCETLNAYDVW